MPTGSAAPPRSALRRPVRDGERAAMRRLMMDRGFEHAIPTIADAVATAVEPGTSTVAEERLTAVASDVEAVVVDALVLVARRHGWSGHR